MKLKNKIIRIFLILIVLPVCVYAQDPFAKLPSQQTESQIKQMSSTEQRLPNRDWWSGSGNGEGPPTSGGGMGGAVGMPLMDGTVPVAAAAVLYFSFLALRRTRRRNGSFR